MSLRVQRRPALAVSLCGVLILGGAALHAAPPSPSQKARKKTPAAPPMSVTHTTALSGDNTPLTEEQKIVHTLNRLGFGPRPGDLDRVKAIGLNAYIEQQLFPERIDDRRVDAELDRLPMLKVTSADLAMAYAEGLKNAQKVQQIRQAQAKSGEEGATLNPAMMTAEQRTQMAQILEQGRRGVQRAITEMTLAKTVRAVDSERQLQEVLVDFWGNHFNIDVRKRQAGTYKPVDDRDVIRPRVLGKFRDLLGASAKSPAMLLYLDNALSSAPRPIPPRLQRAMENSANPQVKQAAKRAGGGINENYAREIMELHTLGVDGGYTQKDVQEVARCLTGWTVDRQEGTFRFDPRRHDDGEKTVLGHTIPAGGGIKDGEMVLDILATHPSTAKYIAKKMCQRFVSDTPPQALVDRVAGVFTKTDGDLRAVTRAIVTSPEFFSRAAYRQKIKSPFEFAVSSVRALNANMDLDRIGRGPLAARPGQALQGVGKTILAGQVDTMGQPLFQYQAPTGYSEDSRKWVSSGALIARLNFALALTDGKVPDVDLSPAHALVAPNTDPAKAVNVLADKLVGGEISPATRATLLKEVTAQSKTEQIGTRRIAALVLGSPEFQRR